MCMSVLSKKWMVLLSLGLLPVVASGQTDSIRDLADNYAIKSKELSYRLETFGSLSSNERTSFWMVNRSWGITPLDGDNYYGKAGVFYKQQLNPDLSYQLGVDLVGTSPQSNRKAFWIQQGYVGLSWKFLSLSLGSKEEYMSGITNHDLSSGDLVYSGNTRPNPEVRISIPNYVELPYTHGLVSVKADFAVGKLLDGDYLEKTGDALSQSYAKNPLTHHKSIYARFGDISNQMRGYK